MPLRLVLIALTLLFASRVEAAGLSSSDIKEKEKAARKACMIGNYEKGVDILSDLFIEVGDPNYISWLNQ